MEIVYYLQFFKNVFLSLDTRWLVVNFFWLCGRTFFQILRNFWWIRIIEVSWLKILEQSGRFYETWEKFLTFHDKFQVLHLSYFSTSLQNYCSMGHFMPNHLFRTLTISEWCQNLYNNSTQWKTHLFFNEVVGFWWMIKIDWSLFSSFKNLIISQVFQCFLPQWAWLLDVDKNANENRFFTSIDARHIEKTFQMAINYHPKVDHFLL